MSYSHAHKNINLIEVMPMKQKARLKLKKSITALIIAVISISCISQSYEYDTAKVPDNLKLHVIPQSHIDLSWWWRYDPEAIDVVTRHTLETAFENLNKYPDYTFTFLQVPLIEPLEKRYPELFYKLRYYLHNKESIGLGYPNPGASGYNGRLAIGSGLWCEVDGSLPCGESLVRHCLYGKLYFKNQFGIDVRTAWVQDAWTHPWTFPQILKKSGIDSYMFTRPRPEEVFMLVPDSLRERYLASISKTQNERMFWWESPDGSRVFAYKPLSIGGENLPPKESIDKYLFDLYTKYGVCEGVTLIGVGNHGGGALKADIERMNRIMLEKDSGIQENKKQAGLFFSTPMQFTSAVLNHPANFPVIDDELVPTIRGSYTQVGEIKKGNRQCENLLMTAEKFSSIASILMVNNYPDKAIYNAWKMLMINQFHDPISGTDINPSIDDVLLRFQQIGDTSSKLIHENLRSIAGIINTEGKGYPIVVFNSLSWKRTDIAEIEFILPAGPIEHIQIIDNEGNNMPIQIVSRKDNQRFTEFKAVFIAKDIPSLGYSTYWLKSQRRPIVSKNEFRSTKFLLENEYYIVKIDSLTGCLTGITDKQHNREILDANSSGNLIQILDDFGDSEGFLMSPEGYGEFNRWTGNTSNIDEYSEIKLIENGPVRTTIQIKRKFQLAGFIQRISLYPNIKRIDFELVVDWNGKNKMVKVAFPLNVKNDSAVYEIPYGTIKRPSLGEEQVAQKWVDISDRHYGVSVLNDSRYGYDVTDNTIRLSILRCPDHPVESTDEKGIHHIRYALYPHAGDWRDANTMHKGYEFNYPLIAINEKSHSGFLPAKHSFVEIFPDNLIVSALKKSEDSDDLIIRFFETSGAACDAQIILSPLLGISAVHKTDLLENEIGNIPVNNTEFDVKVGKYSIESFRLIKDVY